MIEYIAKNGLILIPVLNVLGRIIKEIPKIPDRFIPLILLGFGIIGAVAVMGFNVSAVIQGILITGTAVYGNQLIKQLKKEE